MSIDEHRWIPRLALMALVAWLCSYGVTAQALAGPVPDASPPSAETETEKAPLPGPSETSRSEVSQANESFLRVCRERGAMKRVYMIGASSTGGLTGPTLRRTFKKSPIEFKFWGKASSGLARPDFHDWPKETKRLLRSYKPDLVIVHLGTNDNQGIRKGKGWIRSSNPQWEVEYARRVAHMLDLIAGPDRARPIVWITPVVIKSKNARRLGSLIAKAMRTEVEKFDGGVAFLDVFHTTSKGGTGQLLTMPGPDGRGRVAVYQKDRAHLTKKANTLLVSKPVQNLIEACFNAAGSAAP